MMKTPQTLLKQLLKQGRDLLPDMGGSAAMGEQEYTIDELARVAGTTVRNVRAYQDRGLIAPPVRVGGVPGIYSAMLILAACASLISCSSAASPSPISKSW
jgi:hypothetical protein